MSEENDRFLQHRIREELEWMQDNTDQEVTEQDALDHLLAACGRTDDGACLLAGSEGCEFNCPFRDGPFGEAAEEPTP